MKWKLYKEGRGKACVAVTHGEFPVCLMNIMGNVDMLSVVKKIFTEIDDPGKFDIGWPHDDIPMEKIAAGLESHNCSEWNGFRFTLFDETKHPYLYACR